MSQRIEIGDRRGRGARFTANRSQQLWLAATGRDTASTQLEAVLTPYDELWSSCAEMCFSVQWSILVPMSTPLGRFVELTSNPDLGLENE